MAGMYNVSVTFGLVAIADKPLQPGVSNLKVGEVKILSSH
jgi:hypothetical protein